MRVKITNGAIDVYPYSFRKLKQDNPNTSFPVLLSDERFEQDYGIYRVAIEGRPTMAHNKTADCADLPRLVNSVWTLGWVVRNMTADEIALAAESARAERDMKLANSDWTQISDTALTTAVKTSWATYRTALRDISGQTNFPTDITWPTEP
tara:strand:- start:131 stop:583 length:453 start_codon:yes stop_codon:yes gene_type:complete